ncbi:MAG: inner membrane CreD family protein [Bacteroidota bacterium]
MLRRLFAIAFIFVCTAFAWMFLGGTVMTRTHQQEASLHSSVGEMWGAPLTQLAPSLERRRLVEREQTRLEAGQVVQETIEEEVFETAALAGTGITVDLDLDQRRKGLLWYPTYRVRFDGRYRLTNPSDEDATYRFRFPLPQGAAVFDNVALAVDGTTVEDAAMEASGLVHAIEVAAGETVEVAVGYGSQGMETWRYSFGRGVAQVRDFSLAMTTDFGAIDFPAQSLAPTRKQETDGGWALAWDYGSLVAEAGVGMVLPQKLNPGPWVSRVTFFAPVSLFLFFFVLLVLGVLRGVRLHPMHYFFLASSFFAFHLLLAYLVDHVHVVFALVICSAVSVGLVVSYMRLVTGLRFALVEVGVAQVIYLVVFAFTFFLEGFTGLAVTGLSIATLFVAMQATGRLDWEAVFARPALPAAPPKTVERLGGTTPGAS